MSRRPNFPPTQSPDVRQTFIDVFKITKDAAEALEKIPYVKAVAGVLVLVLQIREVCPSHTPQHLKFSFRSKGCSEEQRKVGGTR